MKINFSDKLNKNFIKNLSEKLLQWTGERWIISLSQNQGENTIFEKDQEKNSKKLEEFKNSQVAKDIENAFPDSKIINIDED